MKGETFVIPKYAYFSTTFNKYGNVHKAKFHIRKYDTDNPKRRLCEYTDTVSDTCFCFATGANKQHAKKQFYKMIRNSGIVLDKDKEWDCLFRNRTTSITISWKQ